MFARCWALVLLVGFLVACGAKQPSATEQAEVGTFGAELAACVPRSHSWTEYDACTAGVERRWSGAWAEAGVR